MIIIIGAGISGLYLGYLLKKSNREFIILEKEDRYGGRVQVGDFFNKQVVLGAGIGRFEKDKILYNLCEELNVPTQKYKTNINYSFKVDIPLMCSVNYLKKIYKKNTNLRSKLNFLDFLYQYYEDAYNFIKISGYTDYIHADIEDTLYEYGFEDNVSGYEAFSIKWQILLDNLYNILKNNIHLNEEVIKCNTQESYIITNKGKYTYQNLICSTPVNIARKIFPNIEILSHLNCQSFSRIYAKIGKNNDQLKEKIKNFTIVDSFLQKIIPIDSDNGIYMLGYNDNFNADLSFKYFMTFDKKIMYNLLEKEIEKIFDIKVEIELSKIAYWEYGTTYYLPLAQSYKDRNDWLSNAINPIEKIFFIGEGFSHNQGWVEGSLESVHNIYKIFNINK
jgi:hypothetical protein